MRVVALLSAVATLALGSVETPRMHIARRDETSGSYAPKIVKCPSTLTIRQGETIDPSEAAYIASKTVSSLPVWAEYLNNVGLEDFDVSTFVPSAETAVGGSTLPLVGFAVAGGGVRAMLAGGGMLAAFDNRNATCVSAKTGGVLQLSQYMSALSGSSWLVGSYALADFSPFETLRNDVWRLTLEGFLTPKVFSGFRDAVSSILKKAATGAPVSWIDAYGRTLAYHLFEAIPSNAMMKFLQAGPGAGTLWSDIKTMPSYINHTAPFPIILTVGRGLGQINVTLKSPIYEMTPYHFGTNVPTSGGLYAPIEYLGTPFHGGTPISNNDCMERFENAGFLMGCSGNVFGDIASEAEGTLNVTAIATDFFINEALSLVPDEYLDNGRIVNPFLGMAKDTGYPATADSELEMTDDGLGYEVIPFFPLLLPQRKLDVIIAPDSSSDVNSYPDGTSIYNSYQKSLLPGYESIRFPVIPEPSSFGLNKKPVFFGSSCYPQPNNATTPLILYLPNYEETYATNGNTAVTTYSTAAQQGFFDNSFNIVTQRRSAAWAGCVACALVDAQQARNGVARTSQCQACFSQHCYMGTK